ncbi:SH3 domain-containing protein [Bacillus subtilis]|nr:hypothetical protein BSK2_11635 [Bacillus subtilis]QCU17280.1 SH3 domain-containing protein [Bacillus subtilis]
MRSHLEGAIKAIEIFNKSVVANRANLILQTSDIIESGVKSTLDQLQLNIQWAYNNEIAIQQLKTRLEINREIWIKNFNTSRTASIENIRRLLTTVYKAQNSLNSTINIANPELTYEHKNELKEIENRINEVEETAIVLTNQDSLSRQNYFEGLNRLWNCFLSFVNEHKPALILIASIIYTDFISPIHQAFTSKYIIDEYIDKKPESVEEAKNVLKEIPMNKELKNNYRMVIKDTLVVRTNPKTKSNIAYVLNKSAIVFIIEKRKNWSRVLFRNEAGEDQSGWVYTRYIKKLD